jgi:hypothetical protein
LDTETPRRLNAGSRLLAWSIRHPMEAFFLFLGLLVGTPLVVGIVIGIIIGVLFA